jgi:TetR/AcrR family transcriptional regulator, lmrAB and yxaGH operons repressor
MAGDTRDRMVEAAVRALQRRGVAGMSFTEILADSGAARGAIYHHFPGGKAQLVAEAAGRNGLDVRAHLQKLPDEDPLVTVEAFLAAVRPVVQAAADGCGCAVAAATVVLDDDSQELRRIAATAFASWSGALTGTLIRAGMTQDNASDLAESLITLLEGAQVLCRATGTLAPFDSAARASITLATHHRDTLRRRTKMTATDQESTR